jgi:hypothetical protein
LKEGDALSPLLFIFASDYAITKVRVNTVGLTLNGTHGLLVYADDVNMLGGSVHTLKGNKEALVAGRKGNGVVVIADRTKYMVMSRYQNAGRSQHKD